MQNAMFLLLINVPPKFVLPRKINSFIFNSILVFSVYYEIVMVVGSSCSKRQPRRGRPAEWHLFIEGQ